VGLEFTLKSNDKRVSLELKPSRAAYMRGERFELYHLILRGQPVTAGQGFFDDDVHLWAEFFEDLAAQGISWSGRRYHESHRGIFRITGTGDGAGGVSLHIELWHGVTGTELVSEGTIHLERKKLRGVAEAARRFFVPAPGPDRSGTAA
jgi:hypothetical protein